MTTPLLYTTSTTYTLTRGHEDDAGLDLIANDNIAIRPGARENIPTGIRIQLPHNTAGLIWSRSGLATKQNIDVKAGLIDPGYTGEVVVCLKNDGRTTYCVHKGDRIAQLLVVPFIPVIPVQVDTLDSSERGSDGFGSTGY